MSEQESVEIRESRLLINDSPTQVAVTVIDCITGEKDEVFIQPMSRARIAARFDVSPVTLSRNPRLKVI